MDLFGRINDCTPPYIASTPESEVEMKPALKISKPELLTELKQGISITCISAPQVLHTDIVKSTSDLCVADYIIEVTDVAGLRKFYCKVVEVHQATVLINMFVHVYDAKNNNVGVCTYDEKEKLYDNIIKGLLRDMK